ncbi:MAG TPA: bacteriohemerythrin [Acetobacteraceae bacterium]|jgi:diguanylate cyclase (GGDEF)-like protein/hemerythrin-like metal-binding protein
MPARFIDPDSLATLLLHSKVVPLALAEDGLVLFANAGFRDLLCGGENPAGTRMLDWFAAPEHDRVGAALRACGQPHGTCIAAARRPDGSAADVELRFDATEDSKLVAAFARDVTQRLRADAQLSLLAYSDGLTGLANRAMFCDRLRQTALTARRAATTFAVLMLDCDGFKAINDRHGHAAGDFVLQRTASRLLACLRDTDTVARLGGDEFAVLLPNLGSRTAASAVAQRLIEAARQPIPVGGDELALGVSVGIAVFPEHAGTTDDLLAAADSALYAAKRHGRGRFAWADPPSPAFTAPAPLSWTAAHEVGVPAMDKQHAALASRLNELGSAMRDGAETGSLLEEAIRYTAFHFATEERLMQAHGYPGLEAHRDLHQQLLTDLRGLRLTGGDVVTVGLVLRYLQEWLLRHVDGADRDFADALHRHATL